MKKIRSLILFSITLSTLLLSCKKEENNHNNLSENEIQYLVEVDLKWSEQNFPDDYPQNNPHFSRLILWTGNGLDTLGSENRFASTGIKNMAETGNNDALINEIDQYIEQQVVFRRYVGESLGSGTGSISELVKVSTDYSHLTFVSMIAPSPDWYYMLKNQNLYENGGFIESAELDLFVYDAGTDNGQTYFSPNEVTTPRDPIMLFNTTPFVTSENTPKRIGTVTITRVD